MVRTRNRGDRSAERERRYKRLATLKAEYLSGRYVIGSFHKESVCDGCLHIFPIWRDGSMRFCSRACAGLDVGVEIARERKRIKHRKYKATVRARLRVARIPRPRKLPAPKADKASRPCRQCDIVFAPKYGSKRRTFCSAKCQVKHSRQAFGKSHRQRARRYGVAYEPVNRLKVFERDRWSCQICGNKTPRKLMGSIDKRSPELDHRIPMAPPHNGPHSYANCQCACRDCNIRKGASMILGQQSLFAYP